MNSSKIKILLIVLLVAVNVFLLINLLVAKSANSFISGELLQSSAKALNHNGIVINSDQIPAQKFTQPVISLSYNTNIRSQSAEKFLGSIVAEYNLPDGNTYQSENAYITLFDNGSFEYGILGAEDIKTDDLKAMQKTDKTNKQASKSFKKMFQFFVSEHSSVKLGYIETQQSASNDLTAVHAKLMLNNLDMYNGEMIALFKDDTMVYFSGRYLFDSFYDSYKMDYIDAPNALFLIKDDFTVDDIRMIYYPVKFNDTEYFLIPSWQISSVKDQIKIFDGVTGYERK